MTALVESKEELFRKCDIFQYGLHSLPEHSVLAQTSMNPGSSLELQCKNHCYYSFLLSSVLQMHSNDEHAFVVAFIISRYPSTASALRILLDRVTYLAETQKQNIMQPTLKVETNINHQKKS